MKELVIILLSFSTIQYSRAVVCTKPWTLSHGNSCYYIGMKPELTFGEARIQCRVDGGHLISFETKEEEAFIDTYLHQHNINLRSFIGATDFGSEGNWYWLHSGKNLTFTNWDVVEPNGWINEDCVWKMGSRINYTWIDISCMETGSYMCEKEGK